MSKKPPAGPFRLNEYYKGYVAPRKTFSDYLTREDIEKRLENYEKVDDIEFVKSGTHIRYFITDKDTGKKKFKNGGVLRRKFPKYVVLVSNNLTWSVPKEGTSFYKKLTQEELLEECDQVIKDQDSEITKLKKELKKLKKKQKEKYSSSEIHSHNYEEDYL